MQYNGTTDSKLFEFWLEDWLLPCIDESQVIIMNSATFHHKNKLFEIVKKYGKRLIFLPPYSPELNPIEKFWAWFKKYLKFNLSLFNSLDDSIYSIF